MADVHTFILRYHENLKFKIHLFLFYEKIFIILAHEFLVLLVEFACRFQIAAVVRWKTMLWNDFVEFLKTHSRWMPRDSAEQTRRSERLNHRCERKRKEKVGQVSTQQQSAENNGISHLLLIMMFTKGNVFNTWTDLISMGHPSCNSRKPFIIELTLGLNK